MERQEAAVKWLRRLLGIEVPASGGSSSASKPQTPVGPAWAGDRVDSAPPPTLPAHVAEARRIGALRAARLAAKYHQTDSDRGWAASCLTNARNSRRRYDLASAREAVCDSRFFRRRKYGNWRELP